jgi:cholesterol oxidase
LIPYNCYSFTIGTGTVVWRGCGLGGGSLVNSNVSIAPDPRVFIQDPWPLAFRQEGI